jgi:hypothetical protein
MMSLRDLLRNTHEHLPQPTWQRPATTANMSAEPRGKSSVDILDNLVFKRDDALVATWIALPAAASKQLPIDPLTARFRYLLPHALFTH